MNCNVLTGLTASCYDNNAGAIKKAWIADYDDIIEFTEDGAGLVTAVTMESTTQFYEFAFKKNTSSYTENKVGELQADVHLFAQNVSIGLRRIEIAKRNAITLLAEGRRNLVVITLDNNDEYRIFGLDDGLRLDTMESGTNETRTAGTFYTLTLMGEERWMAYDIDGTLIDTLTQPAT